MFWRRRARERELDREIRDHLELEAEEQRARGLNADAARHAAERVFGNAALAAEDTRAVWGLATLDRLRQDVRYGFRTLRKNVAFTAAAVLSLALGIGANTAIFSLMNALILRLLPVHDPQGLVQVLLVEQGRPGNSFGYPAIRALAERHDVFANLCGFSAAFFNLVSKDGAERASGAWVTGGYYPTLELQPVVGRLLAPSDDMLGAPPVVVLSYEFWDRRFGRNPNAVGLTLPIEGKEVTIVGVSPPGFAGANVGNGADLTLALGVLPQLYPERRTQQLESGSQWLRVLGRLEPGMSMEQGKARLAVIWPQLAPIATTPRMNPERRRVILASTLDLIPGGTGFSYIREQFRKPLRILMAISGLVLLIACANFANLLLARGMARSKEISLRFAIGAGRGRVIRQLLTESLMLSLAGAALGAVLAGIASRGLVQLLSEARRDGVFLDLHPDMAVLLFTTAIALITGILFGLAPAMRATASGPATALKADAGITPRSRSRLLASLVVVQVALSLLLVIGAGLFVRTLRNLEQLDPGFRRDGVLLVNLDARRAGYRGAQAAALYEDLRQRFARLPGVVTVSLSHNTPLSGGIITDPISINGQPPTGSSHFNRVSPGFFETFGTPVVLGRDFGAQDIQGAPAVAIVNEAFVHRYLQGVPPLGQHVAIGGPNGEPAEIVGVVKATVAMSLREAAPPAVYLPYAQDPEQAAWASLEIHAVGSLSQIAAAVNDELRTQFQQTPVQAEIVPLNQQVARTLVQERLLAALGTCFGVLALLLAGVGLYGMLAYSVTRATSEIGIRMALGADRGEVLWLVLRSALGLTGLGIVMGIPLAWAVSRWIASMLFGLGANDPVTILGATLLLLLAATVAAWLPARRATRVDPMVALRYD